MSLLGAAIGAIGGLFGAKMGANAAEDNLQKQIDWQKEQLQNKHQWEVEDLRKAGLNPILSSHGSSSAASVSPSAIVNPLSGLASSASQLGMLKSEIEKNKADIRNQSKTADAAQENAAASMLNARTNKDLAEANEFKINQDIQNSILATAADVKFKQQQADSYDRLVNGQIANGAAMASAAASQADAAWHNAHTSSAKAKKEMENLDSQIKARLGDIAKSDITAEARRRNPTAYVLFDVLSNLNSAVNPFSGLFR